MGALVFLKHIEGTMARFATLSCVLLIGWLLVAPSTAAAAEEKDRPLTNADVIKMLENKIPESVILAQIQPSPVSFDTSTDAIIELSKNGVSERLLAAMLNGRPAAAATGAGALIGLEAVT